MDAAAVREYYGRPEIKSAIMSFSKDREVAGSFGGAGYGKRPSMLQHPSDIDSMVSQGMTSFHLSAELWKNPTSIRQDNYDQLRKGWDLVMDIDSKVGFQASRACAEEILSFLGKYGIRNLVVKFSGSRGFHIILQWKAFASPGLEKQYPSLPRSMIEYIREGIADSLASRLRAIGLELPEGSSPYDLIDVERSWGSRHMFRAPYSLNEKTWLSSVVVDNIRSFTTFRAHPDRLKVLPFAEPDKGEAVDFLDEVQSWAGRPGPDQPKRVVRNTSRIPESYFPPCIRFILAGLSDGKKRSIFTLVSYLRSMNWSEEEIEARLLEWNSKNRPPLPRSTILSSFRSNMRNPQLPANCFNDQFYVSFGACQPDDVCSRIKNPMTYPFNTPEFLAMQRESRKKELGHAKPPLNYKCLHCKSAFASAKALSIHKSRIHGITD